jgi:3-hydroxyacyl-[acyl-carrier-protein] dehydratase
VEKTKFRKPIVPGDQLMVHMTLVKKKLNLCKFHGVCKVDDKIVAEAFFSANLVDRARV